MAVYNPIYQRLWTTQTGSFYSFGKFLLVWEVSTRLGSFYLFEKFLLFREVSTLSGSFYSFGKFLLIREVMLSIQLIIRTRRNFQNEYLDSYKMKLALQYGFWNFDFFLD